MKSPFLGPLFSTLCNLVLQIPVLHFPALVVIPPPTRSSGRRYSVLLQKFLSFFFFAKGSPRWLYRQGTFITQMVGYRCNFIKLVQNLGADPPLKFGCRKTPQFRSIFGRSPTSPVHCSRMEQDIANLKTDF